MIQSSSAAAELILFGHRRASSRSVTRLKPLKYRSSDAVTKVHDLGSTTEGWFKSLVTEASEPHPKAEQRPNTSWVRYHALECELHVRVFGNILYFAFAC